MEVLVTGGDTDLGRTMAEGFRNDGHKGHPGGCPPRRPRGRREGTRRGRRCVRHHRPDQPHRGTGTVPRHLDTIVNVPAPSWDAGDPRAYSVSDTANAWRNALDATVLSVVLTVQSVGDHLRSGGSIVSVVAENPPAGGAESAIKAALSNWIAGQAAVFGTRGITINTVACGRSVQTGYEGLSRTPAPVAAEIARLALFLTTPAARHITGQTLHVSHGALAHFG